MHWRRKWQPTPVFLPGESQGRGSLVGCRLWGRTESDTTEATQQQQQQWTFYISRIIQCVSFVFGFFHSAQRSQGSSMSQSITPFKGRIVFHWMDLVPSVHLLIKRWAFEFFPLFGYPKSCCYEHLLSAIQLLSWAWLFATPWTATHQVSLSISNSRCLLKLMSIESVMPSNHLIPCHPHFLLPSLFPSIRVFSSESVLHTSLVFLKCMLLRAHFSWTMLIDSSGFISTRLYIWLIQKPLWICYQKWDLAARC